jgi:hypothetical protein
MSTHHQGKVGASSGIYIGPPFPIDPYEYQVNNLNSTLPQNSLLSYPTQTGAVITGIVSGTATNIGLITCANVSASLAGLLILRVAPNSSGHVLDSTRVAFYPICISRVAGSALVATIGTVFGATIATSGSDTITTVLSLVAVVGAVTATNTIQIQVTNTESGGFTSEAQLTFIVMNSQTFGPSIT